MSSVWPITSVTLILLAALEVLPVPENGPSLSNCEPQSNLFCLPEGYIHYGNNVVLAIPLRVKGRTLLEHLARKSSVTDADVSDLLSQLLEALAYLHSRTVCHLDCRVGPCLTPDPPSTVPFTARQCGC